MKNLFFAIVLCGSFMLFGCEKGDERLNIIPLPAEIEQLGGELVLDSLKVFGEKKGENVQFLLDTSLKMGAEGYVLEVSKKGIVLKAKTEAGLFYGEQTLKQLYSNGKFSCVKIKDNPRFSYRGMHLDVSRHFFEKEEVFKLIDAFSFYKINNLHLHLTDAGGWRIQIDKYPKLTSHAAFRTESDWRKWWDGKDRKYLLEGTEGAYGGYYTKDDIKEIVAYAAKRHINILPEIEFPGHSEEVFFAYPNLCCTGKPYTNGDFCIGNKDSYTFLKDVLTEIIELFPSEYIHIGGDEAGKQGWKECKKCKALMKQEGLKDVNELQSYFIKKANEFLKSKGRKLIGWDEILEGGLESDAAIMCWRGEETGLKAAKKGHKVVMTPGKYLYFDFYQADPKTQPYAIGGYTPIKKVYSYNPAPKDSLSFEQQKNILGVQANTWTEYIPDNNHLEYMMFPRSLAVAEMGWTPQENRCWEDFKKRVNFHIPNLKAKGINSFTLSNELETIMVVDTIKKK
jgi:N-acetyl-beta-hexosaminidase